LSIIYNAAEGCTTFTRDNRIIGLSQFLGGLCGDLRQLMGLPPLRTHPLIPKGRLASYDAIFFALEHVIGDIPPGVMQRTMPEITPGLVAQIIHELAHEPKVAPDMRWPTALYNLGKFHHGCTILAFFEEHGKHAATCFAEAVNESSDTFDKIVRPILVISDNANAYATLLETLRSPEMPAKILQL